MIQEELRTFLDGLDRPLPFRKNLERIVEILTESKGDELTESERNAIQEEIQEVLEELGIDTSGSSSSQGQYPPPPGAPGPPGPPGPPRPPGPP